MSYHPSQGFIGRIFPLLACLTFAFFVCGCSLQRINKKSYNLGQVYTTYSGEEMLHFMQADVHRFHSGIAHTNKVIDLDRIRFLGYDGNRVTFEYIRELQDGRLLDYSQKLYLAYPSTSPNRLGKVKLKKETESAAQTKTEKKSHKETTSTRRIYLAGFHIELLQVESDHIQFRVVKEIESLREESGQLKALQRKLEVNFLGKKPTGKDTDSGDPDDKKKRDKLKF